MIRVALVSSDYAPQYDAVGRHAYERALGLTLLGIDVEVIAQDLRPRLPRGLGVRRIRCAAICRAVLEPALRRGACAVGAPPAYGPDI
jgi:hypothetical protein